MRLLTVALALVLMAGVTQRAHAQLDIRGHWTGKQSCKGVDFNTDSLTKISEDLAVDFDAVAQINSPGSNLGSLSASSSTATYGTQTWRVVMVAFPTSGSGIASLINGFGDGSGRCNTGVPADVGALTFKKNKAKGFLYHTLNFHPGVACKISLSLVPGAVEPNTFCP